MHIQTSQTNDLCSEMSIYFEKVQPASRQCCKLLGKCWQEWPQSRSDPPRFRAFGALPASLQPPAHLGQLLSRISKGSQFLGLIVRSGMINAPVGADAGDPCNQGIADMPAPACWLSLAAHGGVPQAAQRPPLAVRLSHQHSLKRPGFVGRVALLPGLQPSRWPWSSSSPAAAFTPCLQHLALAGAPA